MKRLAPLLFFITTSIIPRNDFGQTKKTDSLLIIVKLAPQDSNRVKTLNELGNQYININAFDKVILYEQEAIALGEKLNFKNGLALAYGNMGQALGGLGKSEEAIKDLLKAIEIRKEFGDKIGIGDSYSNIGHIYLDAGNYQDAIKNYEASLEIRKQLNDNINISGCYNDMGNAYYYLGDNQKALEKYTAALEIRKAIQDRSGIASSMTSIASVYQTQGHFEEALKQYFASLKISTDGNYKQISATTYLDIGNTYCMQGNFGEGTTYYLKALKINEELNNTRGIAFVNSMLGISYAQSKNYDEALKFIDEAISVDQALGNKPMLIRDYMDLGIVFNEKAKLSEKKNRNDSVDYYLNKAIKYHSDGLKISKEIGDEEGIAGCYINLGSDLMHKKNFTEAIQVQKAALELFKKSNYTRGLTTCYINIGETEFKKNRSLGIKDNSDAIDSVNKGLAYAKNIGATESIQDAYDVLAEIYEYEKEYSKALEYQKLSHKIQDSLLNNETLQKVEQVRIQYEVEKAVAEENSKKEKEKYEMQYSFSKREDSIRYQQNLTSLELSQQTLLTKQKEQELLLKQNSLDLLNKENEISSLALSKSQAELEAEQSKGKEKEQQLTISENEKALQNNQLALQQTQLNLKETEIKTQKRQLMFYIGGLVLMALLFVFVYRNFKIRQKTNAILAAEKLKAEKAQAAHKMTELELQSLRAQLNPHFMFNSLNAIQELILREDNDNSHLYLSRFAELLRMLLDNANQPFIPLSKEIEFLKLYLSLENLRIADLQFSIDIDQELEYSNIKIPNMMLQPYIENAIWHGLSHKKGDRKLMIRVSKKENLVTFEVQDNGVGRQKAEEMKSLYRKEHRSKGMELLSRRFSLLSKEYGSDIKTNIKDLHENGNATGTLVEIAVPFTISESKPALA